MDEMARTVLEAESQQLEGTVSFEDWFMFAHTLDGYGIAEELGHQDVLGYLAKLRAHHTAIYEAIGAWQGSRLELRLVLFFEARARRFTDAPGHSPSNDPAYRKMITDLLEAISVRVESQL